MNVMRRNEAAIKFKCRLKKLQLKHRNENVRHSIHYLKVTVFPVRADSLAASRMRTTITLVSKE